jgi:hypothetical protein
MLNVRNGSIGYLSIHDNLKFLLQQGFFQQIDGSKVVVLNLKFNIDGLPIYNSSSTNLWPVLMAIDHCAYSKPLPVALFSGIGKPDFTDFLREELQTLKNGLFVDDYIFYSSQILFICDAPARSSIQAIKGHN